MVWKNYVGCRVKHIKCKKKTRDLVIAYICIISPSLDLFLSRRRVWVVLVHLCLLPPPLCNRCVKRRAAQKHRRTFRIIYTLLLYAFACVAASLRERVVLRGGGGWYTTKRIHFLRLKMDGIAFCAVAFFFVSVSGPFVSETDYTKDSVLCGTEWQTGVGETERAQCPMVWRNHMQ